MQLFDAESASLDFPTMAVLVDETPSSSPLLQNRVREIAKAFTMFYPIHWQELAEISLLRSIVLQRGIPVSQEAQDFASFSRNLAEAVLSIPSLSREEKAFVKNMAFLQPKDGLERKNPLVIQDFLSLPQKGLELLKREALIVGLQSFPDRGETPVSELELIDGLIRCYLPMKSELKIIDSSAGASLIGSYLVAKRKPGAKLDLYTLCRDPDNLVWNRLSAMGDGRDPDHCFSGCFLSQGCRFAPYDAVILHEPWGEASARSKSFESFLKTTPYKEELAATKTTDWARAVRMLSLLKEGGIGIWITNGKGLTSLPNKRIVERILKENKIAAIVRLPRGTVEGNLPSPVLVVFQNGRTASDPLFQVDARPFSQKGRKSPLFPSELVARMAVGKRPCAFVATFDPETMLAQEKEHGGVSLKEVSEEIFRGTDLLTDAFIAEHRSDGKDAWTVLRLNDLGADGSLVGKDAPSVLLDEEERAAFGKFLLKKGDLLIKSRGQIAGNIPLPRDLGKIPLCLVYEGEPEKVLATASIMVVRPRQDKLDPDYLQFYLQSRIGMDELSLLGSGRNSIFLTKSSLENFKLPLPALEEQKEVGHRCRKFALDINAVYREFQKKVDEFTSYLCRIFAKGA